MPYIYGQAKESVEAGIPLMRPMYLEFPEDQNTATLDRQYMLGSDVLVAPVMTEEGDVDYYLPAGKWEHILDGRVVEVTENGRWMTENYDFMSLPLWRKIG